VKWFRLAAEQGLAVAQTNRANTSSFDRITRILRGYYLLKDPIFPTFRVFFVLTNKDEKEGGSVVV
jgi:hypothetical protein